LARAREEYRWTKEYAISTAPDQAGLTDEERAAAERAAAGEPEDDGIVEEAPNDVLAAQLEADIERQRAKEAELRAEAVAAAEAELQRTAEEAARLE